MMLPRSPKHHPSIEEASQSHHATSSRQAYTGYVIQRSLRGGASRWEYASNPICNEIFDHRKMPSRSAINAPILTTAGAVDEV
jgi:hypothetical protein